MPNKSKRQNVMKFAVAVADIMAITDLNAALLQNQNLKDINLKEIDDKLHGIVQGYVNDQSEDKKKFKKALKEKEVKQLLSGHERYKINQTLREFQDEYSSNDRTRFNQRNGGPGSSAKTMNRIGW